MIEEDELVEELTAMFAGLEDSEGIELATRNGASALAAELALQLERDPAFDLEGWLVDHDEVVELYADEDALNAAFQPIRHRLAHGDPAPKWNDELAAPILANRDDLQARLVFGDWLQQEGDPRGELLAVQTGLRVATDPATKDRLEAQERSLLARYRSFFVGSLSRIEGFRVFWECGYFDEAQVPGIHVEDLLTLESARMLRRLDVRSDVAAVSALMKREVWPRSLRDLRIGVADAADDEDSSPDPVTLAGAGFEKLGLENLEVIADSVHLGAPLASVKRIRIDAGELAIAPGVLAGSTKLEHLELHLHESAGEELARSFTPPPPKLTHLRISATSYGGFPFAELITSPLLAQLRVLDIRGTYLHGHHVTNILAHAKAFAHLERLDLRGIRLGASEDQLLALCPNVLVGSDPEARVEYDPDYDEDEEDGGDDDDFDSLANEDDFQGEEEAEEADEETDEADVPAVDQGAPAEERTKEDDDA